MYSRERSRLASRHLRFLSVDSGSLRVRFRDLLWTVDGLLTSNASVAFLAGGTTSRIFGVGGALSSTRFAFLQACSQARRYGCPQSGQMKFLAMSFTLLTSFTQRPLRPLQGKVKPKVTIPLRKFRKICYSVFTSLENRKGEEVGFWI